MSGQDGETSAALCIPEADGLISAAAGQQGAAGIEGHRPDPMGMAGQLARLLELHIPQVDCTILAAAGQQIAAGVEGKSIYPVAVPLQSLEALTCMGIPQAHHL